jgi:beta-lactam-binding protein with PASTA domain
MGKIFIGYRREDSAGHTGRLFDRLSEHFGEDRVFMDVSGIEPGVDFVDAIDKAVGSSDAFIVVIGKQWLSATDADGRRRLDNPEDFIRLEIAAALRRNIRVIPVLVQGAAAPSSGNLPEDLKKLSRLHAHEISDSRWDYDVGTLIQTLEKVLKKEVTKDEEKKEDKGQPIPPPPPSKFLRWVIAAIAAVVVGIGIYIIMPPKPPVEPGIEMPNVVGERFEKAKAVLADKGLSVSTSEKKTGEKPPGTVVDQKPEPGTKLKRGDRVELVLAVRPPITKMPNVRGKQIDEARDILSKTGLRISDEKQIKTSERSPGTVLNQIPEPGVEVEPGKRVVLEVAVKSVISVPNVVGVPVEKAKAMLADRGLAVSIRGKQTGEKPPGTVLYQKPEPGSQLAQQATVNLVIAEEAKEPTPRPEATIPARIVQGRVLFDENPVPGATVHVTEEYSFNSTRYGSAITDAKGYFSISGIPDGKKYLYVFGNQPEYWVSAVTPFEMVSGKGTQAENTYLCKGFTPASPKDGQTVIDRQPILAWDAFPNAVNYAVRIFSEDSKRFIFSRGDRDARITQTNIKVDKILEPGRYSWRVDAFNKQGHIIGCSHPQYFLVR